METLSQVKKTRMGRKRVTTKRQDRKLIRESARDRKKKKSSSELAAALLEDIEQTISARTARKRQAEAGLKGCKARKKSWISEYKKKTRLEWSRRHQHFTEEDCSNFCGPMNLIFELSILTLFMMKNNHHSVRVGFCNKHENILRCVIFISNTRRDLREATYRRRISSRLRGAYSKTRRRQHYDLGLHGC